MPDIKKTILNKSISVKPQSFNTPLGVGDVSASAKNAEKAKIWAEGTDEQVEALGGEHSAKGWAEEASAGGGEWGDISGNISDQTDLQNALNLKMDKSGGTFTGDIMLSSGISLKTSNGKLHEVNNKLVLGDSSNNGLYINPNGQTAALINGNTVKNIITSSDITSIYSATGLDPVNGTAVASAISTKQDTLPSGITGNYLQKTSSGVTWAAVDALPSQAGQSGKYLTTDGTTASWGTVSTGGIQNESSQTGAIAIGGYNTAVGTNKGTLHTILIGDSASASDSSSSDPSVTIGYNARGNNGSVTVGRSANSDRTSSTYNTAVGNRSQANNNSVAIGSYASAYTNAVAIGGNSSSSNKTNANGDGAIAIGSNAVANGAGTIQIGEGRNSTAGTVQIGSYPLLDATGKIVEDRLPSGGSGADTSLSNITDAGKIAIAHNAMPSLTYDELTPTSGQTYTAPADGYFYLLGVTNGADAYIEMYDTSNNEAETSSVRLNISFARTFGSTLPFLCPAFKGQKFVLLYQSLVFSYTGFTNLGMKFFYAVGSESEQGA